MVDIHRRIDEWLLAQQVVTEKLSDSELYYYAVMKEIMPGLSKELTDEFFNLAKEIIEK